MELRKYLRIVTQWWWLVLSAFLVVTAAGFTFSFLQPPKYRTALTLVVSPKASITELSTVRQSLDTLDNPTIINTYAEIVRSRNIYDKAIESMGISPLLAQQVDVQVEVVQRTNLIKIQAEGTNPKAVYTVTNAIAGHAIQYVDKLYELYEIKILDPAVLPTTPFSPDILRNTLLAAALGLIFGVSASFFAEYIRRPLEILETFTILDQETGLYNKRYFLQRLREEINRSKRHGRSLAVCMVNIKNLDQAEEMYPQQTRLTIRRRAVSYLKRHIRTDEILARWDGSSLAWLLFETSEHTTRQAIERLSGVLESKVFEDDETGTIFTFAANFGAAIYNADITESELISMAEQALRQTRQYSLGSINIVNGNSADLIVAKVRPEANLS
jgi:diguanylate cyclase (GGDEF)-like protein